MSRYFTPGSNGSACVPLKTGRMPGICIPYVNSLIGKELESETRDQIGCGYLFVSISHTGITFRAVSFTLRSNQKESGSIKGLSERGRRNAPRAGRERCIN